MSDKEPTLNELHEALQELINRGYEVQRHFNEEMNALHEQTREVQRQVLTMLIRERQSEARNSSPAPAHQ
jgi:Na+/phosphate symporter